MSDNLAKTNPRVPFLNFVIDDGDAGMTITIDPTDRSLKGPPYVTRFQLQRKVRSFSASSWTVSLFDPTFELLENMLVAFYSSELTGLYGAVNYSFGYVDANGHVESSPVITGMVTKVQPQYTRQGMRLTLSGIDFDLLSASKRLPMQPLYDAAGRKSCGLYSGWNVGDFTASVLSAAGIDAEIAFVPDGIQSSLLMDSFPAFGNPDGEEGMYNGLLMYLFSGGGAESGTMSLSSFCSMMEDYCGSEGVTNCDRIHIRFDGETVEGNTLKLSFVDILAPDEDTLPCFDINTTTTEDGGDNLSNVISFAPALDELSPLMYGVSSWSTETTNRYTRELEKPEFDLQKDLTGIQVGDGFMLSEKAVDTQNMNDLHQNLTEAGYKSPAAILQRRESHDAIIMRRVRRTMANTFAAWAMQGSLTVAFPPPAIAPWEYVMIRVLIREGKSSVVSGRWLITDIKYSIQPGKLQGTFTLVKSGPSDFEADPLVQPENMSIIHDPATHFVQVPGF